ncbi:hypothetical protein LWI29_010076 [Acer saccharum]|uniref:Uncharacterized protein n=1 Tax=Acer saccharum TaxID=4024 RepID=A0AA39SAJ4_ACESA|nr:hypothetical protein LWI29_010076 [Acer saccharum]
MEATNAKDRAISFLEQLADSQRELALTLKKAKSLEAEIPVKIGQAVEVFKASKWFDELLEKEYDQGVNECHYLIRLTHPVLELKSLDNAIAKMTTQKEEDSKSSDEAIAKSDQTEEEGDQVEEEGSQVLLCKATHMQDHAFSVSCCSSGGAGGGICTEDFSASCFELGGGTCLLCGDQVYA